MVNFWEYHDDGFYISTALMLLLLLLSVFDYIHTASQVGRGFGSC